MRFVVYARQIDEDGRTSLFHSLFGRRGTDGCDAAHGQADSCPWDLGDRPVRDRVLEELVGLPAKDEQTARLQSID